MLRSLFGNQAGIAVRQLRSLAAGTPAVAAAEAGMKRRLWL